MVRAAFVGLGTLAFGFLGAAAAIGQDQLSTRIETQPLYPVATDRYRPISTVEPARQIILLVGADSVLRSVAVPLGGNVREGAEIAQLDRSEAQAKLKIAEAVVKERGAELEDAKAGGGKIAVIEARLEAARAEADLAKMALDRCTLRAPFSGKITAVFSSPGQVILKGAAVGNLADVTSLRVLVPVDRSAVQAGATIKLNIEGKPANGKVETIVPLPDSQAILREIAAPYVGAWVSIPNGKGEFEPGQRAWSPYLPDAPIALVPPGAVREGADGGSAIQVIRNEFVSDIPVRVLGAVTPEWTQVSGAIRTNDLLIAASSAPIAAGSFVRMGGDNAAADAGGPGTVATVTPPTGSTNSRVAPIGSAGGGSRKNAKGSSGSRKPQSKPAPGNQGGAPSQPF